MGNIAALVNEVIRKAPEWIRRDLNSKESTSRMRAEESLSAMVAKALEPEAEEQS